MFRHHGKTRTLSHNLKIASLLSFVAGIVNVAGFLAVQQLTTNVTGHFAFFVDEVFKLDFRKGFVYFLYIFFFFLGSFSSNFLAESIKKNDHYVYAIPISIECLILLIIGFLGHIITLQSPNIIAFSLLFAMGMQNSLVTKISNATVRTTHLTGLFTDLGIELSQLFFYKAKEQRAQLIGSVKLRFTIIGFFFMGGIFSGVLYSKMKLHILIIAAMVLLIGLIYDNLKLRLIHLKRKLKHHEHNRYL